MSIARRFGAQQGALWIKTAYVPYWSDDLKEYVFDENYGGKTYCTVSNQNLGVTQDQTKPSTITLCPSAFTNPQATANLGSKAPKVRMSIDKVLPQSGTFYHELFHLVWGSEDSPDVELPKCYSWKTTQLWLEDSPNIKPGGYDEDYQHLIRRNPESYLWFSVGYWLFLQTQWSDSSNQRWSFDTGVARLISI
ncbi:uncharacterized protein N7473_004964 [Penicillium subrubescens]|uniref:uncharacterized protein n=1 Tax=Penicillium subrubescens TaxID=1316194 RepID=UPI00254575FA|nr:uncharacterized protein N7473_004964 [Penicillium subrubescens]KAJ5900894.1 hypothetical protein N7473_004964 [Penicillium subrubescens]